MDEFIELAEAGKLTVKAFEDSSIAEQFIKDTGLSAEEATRAVNKLVDSSTQLSFHPSFYIIICKNAVIT